MTPPFVSCIMPTANRRRFVPEAIRLFLAQDHPEKELLILDDGTDAIADLVPADPRIRYLRETRRAPIGAKRNRACEVAHGEIIVHWDDDDWYAPWRLSYQVSALQAADADACGLDRVLYRDEADSAVWEYVWPQGGGAWLHGATLCYRRALWQRGGFPAVAVGEDTQFLRAHPTARLVALPRTGFYVGRIHAANTSRKVTADPRWQRRTATELAAMTKAQLADTTLPLSLREGEAVASTPACPAGPPIHPVPPAATQGRAALVATGAGIGDVIRTTPLIRVLHRLGYQVDVLLAAHSAEAADLLRGAPEVRQVILAPGLPAPDAARPPDGSVPDLVGVRYDIAAFTYWAAPLARTVTAERTLSFPRDRWLAEGDSASVEHLARELGWTEPMPPPFAVASSRRFDLPTGTVVLHPGCKPEWPWKRWHGFDALAALLPAVAVVGTPADRDNRGSYFGHDFVWPPHVRDFTGQLSLADTAALIGQCAALVSNDSGLMHLGVALGVKTIGVFGITSPAREAIPAANMIPISKGLDCEPECRRGTWGRRDCPQHLACLTTLTAEEVKARLDDVLSPTEPHQTESPLRVTYTAAVFDATGYGQAARLYVHALHRAGVKVAVTDAGATPPQVQDTLVASLLGRDDDADFHIFHGIPPYWARAAFPRQRVIAVTVWETDTMPQHWRGPLTHAIDVWLPCQFNVEVFARGLGRAPFLLPHALGEAPPPAGPLTLDGVADQDFVFYAVFEWQDRKNPEGMIEAFLHAFPVPTDAVLVLKCGPASVQVAHTALLSARRRTGAQGRVVPAAAAWEPAQLAALQARGDCYVSLHKGEGWGYPLFEAAARGTPVIATGYSGPLDYLDPAAHWLVRHQLAPVRQRYAYYQPTMRWAEPDLHHAAEGMRWIYANRALARERAATAARTLRSIHTLERIGGAAKARLLALRAPPPLPLLAPAARPATEVPPARTKPPVPIPGHWYDTDYFENGRTSNWDRGYHWSLFQTVFRDASTWLVESFPEAGSVLDIGCAKGFLVRALRERGIDAFGFDHSPWAIDHAEPTARPYLRLAGVDDVDWAQGCDLATAMFVLESLTETQLRAFLPRARTWVRQALVAIIAQPGLAGRDRDPTRITRHDRAGWRALFLECGWRQDVIHRLFEKSLAAHSVPRGMGWDVHVFAPGH
jgi:ADP-heptose:LPS heptosyltransferase/glycosyltransferase involved in cell wall biosynthesis/SAM-dependent methyltransferase